MESYSFVVIGLRLNLFEHFFPFFHFYLSTSSYVFPSSLPLSSRSSNIWYLDDEDLKQPTPMWKHTKGNPL